MATRITEGSFDPGAELSAFSDGLGRCGAVVSFTGVVRDLPEGGLEALELEHYAGMTERAVEAHRQEALKRFALAGALVIHRYGRLTPGEPIMMVATAAPHRLDTFRAAEFLMDYLKSRAPFWKREITTSGPRWVAADAADEAALERWTR